MKFLRKYQNFGKFSLNENVKQSLSILSKLGKDRKDPEYSQVIEVVGDNKSYLGLFTDYYFNQGVGLTDLEILISFLRSDDSKSLPKNTLEYKKYEDLIDDMAKVIRSKKVKYVWNELPMNLKEIMKSEVSKENIENLFVSLYDSPSRQGFFKKISKAHDAESLIDLMTDFVEKGGDDYYSILDKIENTDGAELTYTDEENEIIIAKISIYEASKSLGSTNWCIVNSSGSFDNYTSSKQAFQYFVWNFKLDTGNKYRLCGYTVDYEDIVNAHDFNDTSILNSYPKFMSDYFKYLTGPSEDEVDELEREKRRKEKERKTEAAQRERERINVLIADNEQRREDDEWADDKCVKALIEHLDIDLDELREEGRDIYDVIFETGTHYHLREFESADDPGTYAVGDEDDTKKSAKECLETLIDDIGVTGFNEWFWKNHLDGEKFAEDLISGEEDHWRDNWQDYGIEGILSGEAEKEIEEKEKEKEDTTEKHDELETYISELDDKLSDAKVELADKSIADIRSLKLSLGRIIIGSKKIGIEPIHDVMDNYDLFYTDDYDKLVSLMKSGNVDKIEEVYNILSEFMNELEEKRDELYSRISDIDYEIDEIKEDEDNLEMDEDDFENFLERKKREYARDPEDVLKEYGYSDNDLNNKLKDYVDIDSLIDEAIEADGYGHNLSGYDGRTNEYYIDEETIYVFRTN